MIETTFWKEVEYQIFIQPVHEVENPKASCNKKGLIK